MKTKMGIRHKFAYSFYNFTAYKEFLVQGLGKSILYIFLVTLMFSTLTSINTIDEFNSELSNIQQTFIHSAPNFELKDGLLSLDSDEPIYYKYDGNQLIVDTSGKSNKSIIDSYSNAIYINSDEITVRENYRTLKIIKFAELTDFNLTNKTLQGYISILKIIFPILILIFGPIFSLFINLISGFLIIAPLSQNISSLMGVKLKYSKACILSFYAMTLPLLLESLLNISKINISGFYIIFYVVALIYCGLAIKELKNIDKSTLNVTK